MRVINKFCLWLNARFYLTSNLNKNKELTGFISAMLRTIVLSMPVFIVIMLLNGLAFAANVGILCWIISLYLYNKLNKQMKVINSRKKNGIIKL